MHLSNDVGVYGADAPGAHNERIKTWIMHQYRDEHRPGGRREVHLSTCPDVEVLYDLYDGWCANDDCTAYGPCETLRCHAELTCPHGVDREFDIEESDHVEDLIARLEADERFINSQRSKQVVQIGYLQPGPDVLTMIVVYRDTLDYPGLYVARQHDIGPGVVAVHPSPMVVATSLRDVRGVVPPGMIRVSPAQNDDPKILEVYV